MNKFEDLENELPKNDQEKEESDGENKEKGNAEDQEKKEVSQEKLDKTLGEINK